MYAGTMTKEQALQAMKEGKKVAHSNFTPEEYLHMVNGVITSEDGYNFERWFNEPRDYAAWKFDGVCWLIRE